MIVASTAIWAPRQMGSPLATTSMRRPSPAGTSRLRSRRATCDATWAPASLQMRAAARSRGGRALHRMDSASGRAGGAGGVCGGA